jgi:hypothetical protein
MVIVEFMDMKSTKYGGLGRFMLRLIRRCQAANFGLYFKMYPKASKC